MTFPAFTEHDKCPEKKFHGNPYRYCGTCGWMEEEQPVPGKPPTILVLPTSEYVFDLIRTLKGNAPLSMPLDFQGHAVPADVQEELQRAWPSQPRAHQCIIDVEVDPFAHRPQYLIGCQCHEGGTKHIWQPGDGPYTCPTARTVVEDPRTLLPPDTP